MAILKLVEYTLFLCLVINNFFRCIGRNKSKDLIFDFSRLWTLIVGLYATWVLRLAFNLQNYACKCFYLFSQILLLSRLSLQHLSRVEAAAAAHRPLSPLTAVPHRLGSQYRFVPVLG